MFEDIPKVLAKLEDMRARRIWPNGLRYLWTDAFGVVLLVSLSHKLRDERYLDQARWVVGEVERVLGRRRGLRIGEKKEERDGQHFHYLAMWIFALTRLGGVDPAYRSRAIQLVKDIHPRFVDPEVGISWKMTEDLSGLYPGCGLGALDPFYGYVVYRLLAPQELSGEIGQMAKLVERTYRSLAITQDLGLGMMLLSTSYFPMEGWAVHQRRRSLVMLERLWVEPSGYFCREPFLRHVKFRFANYGVSLGLQAVGARPERVTRLNRFLEKFRSRDEYDTAAITHVMACTSLFPGDFLRRAHTLALAHGGW
jgi:hypothetical protein